MAIYGRVENGVVIPERPLPDGARVEIAIIRSTEATGQPVQLPLVPSAHPGSVELTSQQIAGLLEGE